MSDSKYVTVTFCLDNSSMKIICYVSSNNTPKMYVCSRSITTKRFVILYYQLLSVALRMIIRQGGVRSSCTSSNVRIQAHMMQMLMLSHRPISQQYTTIHMGNKDAYNILPCKKISCLPKFAGHLESTSHPLSTALISRSPVPASFRFTLSCTSSRGWQSLLAHPHRWIHFLT